MGVYLDTFVGPHDALRFLFANMDFPASSTTASSPSATATSPFFVF
jgi:hypothetical protein